MYIHTNLISDCTCIWYIFVPFASSYVSPPSPRSVRSFVAAAVARAVAGAAGELCQRCWARRCSAQVTGDMVALDCDTLCEIT